MKQRGGEAAQTATKGRGREVRHTRLVQSGESPRLYPCTAKPSTPRTRNGEPKLVNNDYAGSSWGHPCTEPTREPDKNQQKRWNSVDSYRFHPYTAAPPLKGYMQTCCKSQLLRSVLQKGQCLQPQRQIHRRGPRCRFDRQWKPLGRTNPTCLQHNPACDGKNHLRSGFVKERDVAPPKTPGNRL